MENKEDKEDVEIVEACSSSSALPTLPTINLEEKKDDAMDSKNATNEDKDSAIDRAYIMDNIMKTDVHANDPNIKLLNLVNKNPCLYDRWHEKYNDSNYTTEIWKDIGTQMNRKHGEVKRKFKSLFVRFANTYLMLRDPDLVSQGYPKKKFIYYEEMLKLKKYISREHAKRRIRIIVKTQKKAQKKKLKLEKQTTLEEEQSMLSTESQDLQPYQRRPAEPDIFQRRPETHSKFEISMPVASGPPQSEYLKSISVHEWDPCYYPMCLEDYEDLKVLNQSNQRMNKSEYEDQTMFFTPVPARFSSFKHIDESRQRQRQNKMRLPSPVKDNRDNTVQPVDDSHIDFFFKSISQQVGKANISDKNFMDLQFAILTAVSRKLSTYYK